MGNRRSVLIGDHDRALFNRCRELNMAIASGIEHVTPDAVLKALRSVQRDKLPPDKQRDVELTIARAERDAAALQAAKQELEQISIDAEIAAQRITSQNLRRFVQLYCIDGWDKLYAVARELKISPRTAANYSKLLHEPRCDSSGCDAP